MAEDWSQWIGRTETRADVLDSGRADALRVALGLAEPLVAGAPLPLLYHWLYFWDVRPPAGLGPDGHPARGGFLPPVPLPRRMWAGGSVQVVQPLVIGEAVVRESRIAGVETKSGRSGTLVFVTVEHEIRGANGVAVMERQDIVYRDAAAPGSIALPPADAPVPQAAWQNSTVPDPVLLFRYSALTMNGHRIHYDRPYAMQEEAYPALVVHGPLQATMLADLAERNLGRPVSKFEFRGTSPAFDGLPLQVCGERSDEGARLWTEQGGVKSMVATAS